ncbi:MAG TPA: M67 family metallopeptidase [Gemmatimonadales bacterium]|jgi:proteasome lid subunit RPN8/RPN11|nr:M67 family metallopeptidase [Gemmatimonadales bacterium]
MTLRLPAQLIEAIREHGERAYPSECCGVLVGRLDGDGVKEVTRLAPAVNRRTDDPHRYLIAPDDLRRLESTLRTEGLEVVGYYHSHPDHPAVPSAFDAEHAWPWYSYLIVSVEGGRGTEVASWLLDDERPIMHPEPLEVPSEV